MAGILTALLSGALMSIQGVFNTEVTKQTSTWLAAGWVQISAFAVCLAAWCITGREPIGDLFRVKPWYLLLGGAIGAFITITVIWSMAGSGSCGNCSVSVGITIKISTCIFMVSSIQ